MIPLRPSDLKYEISWPRHIIIHSTHELGFHAISEFDNPKGIITNLQNQYYQITGITTLPYNFLVGKLRDDYQIFVERPLLTSCYEFKDILPKYQNSVHIALIGNYDEILPTNRLYQVLSYKLLCPMLRLLRLNEDRIYTHSEATTDDDIICPGELINKQKIISMVRNMMRKRSLSINFD